MKKENITLVGMPGAGKSTVGVVLAKIAGYHFLDSDLLIQQKTGKLLHELIEIHGREGFLEIEGEINASIDTKCTVIATGGSVVYEENAMQHLKEISTVVYIYLPYEELRTRLGSLEQRGVALKPEETLKDLYDSRSVLYKKYADITVDASHMGIQAVAEEIRPILFDPFVRGDKARTSKGGTGLGLAIARKIVGKLGGTIEYTYDEGKNQFKITL